MYAQCPECLTIYKLGAAVLGQSHGAVRCGHCNAVFDALRSITEQLPDESVRHLLLHPGDDAPPQLSVPAMRPRSGEQQALLFDPDERPQRVASTARRAHTPAFARSRAAPRSNARLWPWRIGVGVLLVALLAQIGYAERQWLLDDAVARPWLDQACRHLHCQLPLRHDPALLELLSRDIRPHPSVPHALIISATLRNDAPFAQAFPAVEITLSDLDENRIAMRRFLPRDYLPDARSIAAGLAPGATASLVFEVEDPGKNAVAFEFRFL